MGSEKEIKQNLGFQTNQNINEKQFFEMQLNIYNSKKEPKKFRFKLN